jgi:tetratricopeptide (TPR) repeat protein
MFRWRERKSQPNPDEGDPASRALEQLQEAIQLMQAGQPQPAVPLLDEVTVHLARVVQQEGRLDLSGQLASAYTHKASAAHQLGDPRAALATYDQAIAIYERLLLQEGQMQWSRTLAMTYTNKGHAATQLGSHRAAGALYQKAVVHYERLVEQEGRKDLAPLLARACLSAIRSMRLDGNRQDAEPLVERAASLGERLISQGGHDDLAPEVAVLYMDQALSLARRGDSLAGVKLYDRTLALRERLFQRTGDADLASAYLTKTVFVNLAEESKPAIALFERAITLYDRLVNQKGRKELAPNLATAYLDMALVMHLSGDLAAARPLFDSAVALYDRVIEQDGRQDLGPDRERAQRLRSELPPVGPKRMPSEEPPSDTPAEGGYQKTVVADASDALEGVRTSRKGPPMNPEDRKELLHRKLIELQDKAIALYERVVRREDCRHLTPLLGSAYLAKADRLLGEGNTQGALPLYEQGVGVLERVVNQHEDRDWLLPLAQGYRNQGRASDPRAALPILEHAIALLSPPTHSAEDPEPWPELGWAYHAKALALLGIGAKITARQAQDQALAIFERLVQTEGRLDLRPELELIRDHADFRAAEPEAPAPEEAAPEQAAPEEAMASEDVPPLTDEEEFPEPAPMPRKEKEVNRPEDLAMASLKEAIAVRQNGNPEAALPLFDDAISRFEHLVQKDGRRDLLPDLERARKSRRVALTLIDGAKHS